MHQLLYENPQMSSANATDRMDNDRCKRLKRKRVGDPPLSLFEKVSASGGPHGFGLDDGVVAKKEPTRRGRAMEGRESGVHGNPSTASCCSTLHRVRLFDENPSARKKERTTGGSVGVSSAVSSRNPYLTSSQRSRSLSVASFASLRAANKFSRSKQVDPSNVSLTHIVCAISENLARETSVASIDAGSPVALIVTKQSNGQTYAETLAYLQVLQPHEVLLNEGRRNSQLAKKIHELYNMDRTLQLPFESSGARDTRCSQDEVGESASSRDDRPFDKSTVVKFISRAYFDQTKGAELLQRVVREETYDASCSEEYILLSSTYALLHYNQQCLGATFSKNSIHLTVNSGGNNRMTIDRSTVFQLELLANTRTGKSRNSLIGTIDCTKTTVGGRLLRANLMSPPTRVDTINTRLDLVGAFLGDEEFFYEVLGHLQTLPDIDKMLSNIALVPWKKTSKKYSTDEKEAITDRVANKGISALVCVKSTLSSLPAFADVLADRLRKLEEREEKRQTAEGQLDNADFACGSPESDRRSILIGLGSTGPPQMKPQRHHLLKAIISTMRQPKLSEVLELVSNIFTESTSFSRNANAMRHHACFALKADSNSMMEVCRKAFLSNVDDIYKLADEYAETYTMHVSVKHSTARGYFLSIPEEHASDLPQVFIQPAKGGKAISCTTQEVHSLNLRAQENVQDLLLMTHEKIQEVLDVARSNYDAFAALSDAVALLDMCHSFADVVALSRLPWCRPSVCDPETESAPSMDDKIALTIVNGRYAIDAANPLNGGSSGPCDFIPNDTFVARSRNFTVITGINGSGKSTYLKQVAIIVLLAHCGSYVPAEMANIPIFDRLCTRIGTTDDQEHNISTFLLEMKETAFICHNASPRSLILIDELGRATSNEDGVAIAWAVSEFLLKKRATTFFVTHYPQLCSLAKLYPAVQNQHLEANISSEGGDAVLYTHRLSQGPCILSSNYGVEMAEACGWPEDVLSEARELRSTVESKLNQGGISTFQTIENSVSVAKSQAEDYMKGVVSALKTLATADDNDDLTVIRSKLQEIFDPNKLDTDVIDGIQHLLFDDKDQDVPDQQTKQPLPTVETDPRCHYTTASTQGATPGRRLPVPNGDLTGEDSWSGSSVSSLETTSDEGSVSTNDTTSTTTTSETSKLDTSTSNSTGSSSIKGT